jgi:integration host factor subunit alpha
MTLTKAYFAGSIRERVRFKKRDEGRQQWLFPEMNCDLFTRRRAGQVVGTFFETVKTALVRGEDVKIRGFGKFQVKFKWARKGRNPRTGEMILISSRRTVAFKVSSKLRRKLNAPEQADC